MKTVVVLAIAMTLSVAAAQQPAGPVAKGVIYGAVIDQDGHLAKDLGLTAYPLGVALGAILPHTKTDQKGKFRFAGIPWWGRYTVFADDEEAGYSLYATGMNAIHEVTLSPEQPEAEFSLVLPPKAGFLKIHLTNQKTGKPIDGVQVKVMSAYDPKELIFSHSCASTRTILIPPDRDLLLHITSSGFHEWSESTGDGMPLRLQSGTSVTLEVQLDPSD